MTFLGLNCVFGAQNDLGWIRGLLEMCSERLDLQKSYHGPDLEDI